MDRNRDATLKEAFGYHHVLVTYALGLLRDRALAEDAVQNAYLALTHRHDTIKGDSVLAWCRGAVRLEALTILRQRGREMTTEETFLFDAVSDAFELEQSPDHKTIRSERLNKLKRCLDELTSRSRELIIERYFDGAKLGELSKKYGMNKSAVRKSIYRGRIVLRECMEQSC